MQFARQFSSSRELLLSQNARSSWLLERILHFDPPKGKRKAFLKSLKLINGVKASFDLYDACLAS